MRGSSSSLQMYTDYVKVEEPVDKWKAKYEKVIFDRDAVPADDVVLFPVTYLLAKSSTSPSTAPDSQDQGESPSRKRKSKSPKKKRIERRRSPSPTTLSEISSGSLRPGNVKIFNWHYCVWYQGALCSLPVFKPKRYIYKKSYWESIMGSTMVHTWVSARSYYLSVIVELDQIEISTEMKHELTKELFRLSVQVTDFPEHLVLPDIYGLRYVRFSGLGLHSPTHSFMFTENNTMSEWHNCVSNSRKRICWLERRGEHP